MSRFRSPVVAAIASAAVTAGVVGGVAIAQTAPTTINACVANQTGSVRIVGGASDCKANESFTTWNQKGEKGDQGLQGLKGDPGDKGDPGADGTDGRDGVSGRQVVSGEWIVPSGTVPTAYWTDCPAGKEVISGGYSAFGLEVVGSYPVDATTWV